MNGILIVGMFDEGVLKTNENEQKKMKTFCGAIQGLGLGGFYNGRISQKRFVKQSTKKLSRFLLIVSGFFYKKTGFRLYRLPI